MRRGPSLAAALACGLLALQAAAAAGDPALDWAQVLSRGVLRVGVPGDYAPYALWRDGGAAIEGADTALAREVAASLGLGIEFVATSWRELMNDARAGRFDVAVGGISITPERRREQAFSEAWIHDHKTPLVRCGEEARFDTRAEIDQPSVRLVANPGGTNERFARREFPQATFRIHEDNLGVFGEVAAGRADVFVTDGVEARLQARVHPGLCVVESAPDWEPVGKGMLIVADGVARDELSQAIAAALVRKPFAQRLEDWLAHDWRPGESPDAARELAHLVDERLAVVTEVARWKWNRRAPIEDPPREASLMAAQRSAARGLGVPEERVDAFFSAQIAAARQLQHDLFKRWERSGAGRFQGVADLDAVLRPRIDAINARMLEALSRWDGRAAHAAGLGPLDLGQLSPDAGGLALAPLAGGAGTPDPSPGR